MFKETSPFPRIAEMIPRQDSRGHQNPMGHCIQGPFSRNDDGRGGAVTVDPFGVEVANDLGTVGMLQEGTFGVIFQTFL